MLRIAGDADCHALRARNDTFSALDASVWPGQVSNRVGGVSDPALREKGAKNRPIERWGGWLWNYIDVMNRRIDYISKGSMPRTGWPFSDR